MLRSDRIGFPPSRTNWFDAVAREVDAVQNRVALADLSFFSKFEISGPDTLRYLDALGANRPPKPGRIGLTYVLTPTGGVASEFTVAMLSEAHAYLTSAAASEEMDLDVLTTRAFGFDVKITNATDELSVIGLMGPSSLDVMSAVSGDDVGPWLSVRTMNVAGVGARVLRVSYVGELGFELHLSRVDAARVFLALEEAGKRYDIGCYGAYAANSMRLEKGYRAWGYDLTTERTPLENGLAPLVKTEARDFIGREAMLAKPKPWDMVLLAIDTQEGIEPFYSHTVLAGGKPVGIVSSGAYGHRVKQSLALAFLRDPTIRTDLVVKTLGREFPARILHAAPYDPNNARMKV